MLKTCQLCYVNRKYARGTKPDVLETQLKAVEVKHASLFQFSYLGMLCFFDSVPNSMISTSARAEYHTPARSPDANDTLRVNIDAVPPRSDCRGSGGT
jgi:hypothetical protein